MSYLYRHAYHYYPGRALDIDLIVIHCTVSPNPGAKGVANYFATPQAGGSTTWVFDDLFEIRCVLDNETCWGAKGHNSNGLHYEFCGYADWTRRQWLEHRVTINKAAKQIASDMVKYKIPFVYPAPIIHSRARNGIHPHYGDGGEKIQAEQQD